MHKSGDLNWKYVGMEDIPGAKLRTKGEIPQALTRKQLKSEQHVCQSHISAPKRAG